MKYNKYNNIAFRNPGKAPGFLAGALAVLLIFFQAFPALAVTQEEIDDLIQEADALEEQRTELNNQINVLSDTIANTLAEKELLDNEIAVLSDEAEDMETRVSEIQDSINQKERELRESQEEEKARYALFCERVRSMEESGEDYRMILFRADGLTDFLSRLDFIEEIMDADRRVMESLKEIQEQIQRQSADLNAEMLDMSAALKQLDEKRAELDQQRQAANDLILELQANKTDAEDDLEYLYQEEDEIQAEITRLSEQYEREQAALEAALQADMSDWYGALMSSSALGGYAWPVTSHKINSTFGGRASPGGIGSTNHKGVDIGGVGYGTPIHASKAGLIIVSERSNSYGNYVVISHGPGNTTLYAHMEKRMVSVGDYVEQGDIIGLTGSTGISTGPHLHFEIAENGIRINPLIYLSDYYLA